MATPRHSVIGCGLFGLLASIVAMAAEPRLDAAVTAALEGSDVSAYKFATPDLDGDSLSDAVVLLNGPDFCGSGGCTLLIFERTAEGYRFVSRSTVTREPIYLLPDSTNGWRTLAVTVAGGGVPTGQALLRFDGVAYPLNPTVEPMANAKSLESAELLKFQPK